MALHVTESAPRKPAGRGRAFAPGATVKAGRELRRAIPGDGAGRSARSTVSRPASGSPATVRRRRDGVDLGLLHPWPVLAHYQPVHRQLLGLAVYRQLEAIR